MSAKDAVRAREDAKRPPPPEPEKPKRKPKKEPEAGPEPAYTDVVTDGDG